MVRKLRRIDRLATGILIVTLLNTTMITEAHVPLSQIEIDLEDYIMGFRIASCGYHPWNPAMDAAFREVMAENAKRFCKNLAACNLKTLNGSHFSADNVAILENYPKWDFTAVRVRFVFIYPHGAVYLSKQMRPLMLKQLISRIMAPVLAQLSADFGWQVLDFERSPRYDPVTEFMNIAILPIIILIIIFMFALATWSSKFSSRTEGGGETWTVKGVSGGKNTAAKRIQDLIDEENLKGITLSKRFEDGSNSVVLNVDQLQKEYDRAGTKHGRSQHSASGGSVAGIHRQTSTRYKQSADENVGNQAAVHWKDQRSTKARKVSDERKKSADGGKRRYSLVMESEGFSKQRRSRASNAFQQQQQALAAAQSSRPAHNWMANNIVLRGLQKRQSNTTNKL